MASAGGIRAGRAYVEVGADDSQLAAGLARAQRQLQAMGKSVTSLGKSFVKAGAAAAVPFALAGKSFASFEQALARVKAIRNTTEDQFKSLSDKAKQLGRDTVFSATEAANAMAVLAQKGYSVNQILAATGPVLDLAATAQIGIADAAGIAATVLKGMGLSVDQLAPVIDVLAKASVTASTDIAQLGDAFRYVGPIGRVAKTDLEELTAAIQVLSDAGKPAQEAGTTLRAAYLGLTTPSAEAAAELKKLHVEVLDSKGNFRGLITIFGELEKAMSGFGGGKKLQVLGTVFGAKAATGVAALLEEGTDKLKGFRDALRGAGGTAARVASVQLDTLQGAFKLLLSSLDLVAIELGAALAPAFREIGTVLIGATNGIAELVKNNKAALVTIAKVVAAVLGAGVALVALGAALKLAAIGFGILAAAVRVVTAITAAFKLLTVSISLASAASAIFGALFSPGALVVGGLVALGVWLVKSGKAADTLGSAFDSLKGTATDAIGPITEALKAGDLEGAARIMFAGLKLEFTKGTSELARIWRDFGVSLVEGFRAVSFDIARLGTALFADTQAVAVKLVGEFRKAHGQIGGDAALKGAIAGAHPLLGVAGLGAEAAGAHPIDQVGPDADKQAQEIMKRKEASLKALTDQQKAEADARRKAADDAVAQSRADLKAAQADFDDLVGKGPNSLAGAGVGAALGAPGLLGDLLAGGGGTASVGKKALPGGGPEGLDQGLLKASGKVDTRGSFSAAAIQGMGVGDSVTDAVKEGVKEQKKTNEKLDKVIDKVGEPQRFGA